MSKTKVIEVFNDTQMIIQIGADEKGRVGTVAVSMDDLETLNTDYVNKHFGSPQEAYNKGYKDGKESIDKGCNGCIYEHTADCYLPCKSCCNAYSNKYTPMPEQDDSVKVGDEVTIDVARGTKGILLEPETENLLATVVIPSKRWNSFHASHKDLTKTGRHFVIEGIMEAMKN